MGEMRLFLPDGVDFSSEVMLHVNDPVMYEALMAKLTGVDSKLVMLDLDAVTALVESLVRATGRVLYVDNDGTIAMGPPTVALGDSITSASGGGVFVGQNLVGGFGESTLLGRNIDASPAYNALIISSGVDLSAFTGGGLLLVGDTADNYRTHVFGDSNNFDGSGALVYGTGNTVDGQGHAFGRGNESTGQGLAVGLDNFGSSGGIAVGIGNDVQAGGALGVGKGNHVRGGALAVGENNLVDNSAVVYGRDNEVNNGGGWVVFGEGNTAEPGGALIIGVNNTASGGGTAIGDDNNADGSGFVVGGSSTVSSGGVAFGYGAEAHANSLALGDDAIAGVNDVDTPENSKENAVAIGPYAKALHTRSVAFGWGDWEAESSTTADDQVAVGPRHFEIGAVAEPGLPAAGAARMYFDGDHMVVADSTRRVRVDGHGDLAPFTDLGNMSGALDLTSFTLGDVVHVAATGDLTLAEDKRPTVPDGMAGTLTLVVKQDATGGRTFAPANMTAAGGLAPSMSTTGGAVDVLQLRWDGVRWVCALDAKQVSVPAGWVV